MVAPTHPPSTSNVRGSFRPGSVETRSTFVRTKRHGYYQSISPSAQKLAQLGQRALQRNRINFKASQKKSSEARRSDSNEEDSDNDFDSEYDDETDGSYSYLDSGSGSFSGSDGSSFFSSSTGSKGADSNTFDSYEDGSKADISPRYDEEGSLPTNEGSFDNDSKIGDGRSPSTDENESAKPEGDLAELDGNPSMSSDVEDKARNHLCELDALPVTAAPSSEKHSDSELDDDDTLHDMPSEGHQRYPESILRLMKPPQKQLMDLLIVARNEPTGPRRSNACGALKTLAASKPNRVRMAWTKGVIVSLSHVLNDIKACSAEIDRTLAALLYLCLPPKNWAIVYQSPGLVQGLVRAVNSDCPQTRKAACLCIEQLAKHKGNRRAMTRNEGVMSALTRVVKEHEGIMKAEKSSQVVSPRQVRPFFSKLEEVDVGNHGENGAVLIVLTVLLSLANLRDNSYLLARNQELIEALVGASGKMLPAANVACTMTLANLSRHPANAVQLVFHVKGLTNALVSSARSNDEDCRLYAYYALQNLSCDTGCREELGNSRYLLRTLSQTSLRTEKKEEQLAALTTLKNLSKEASNLVNFTTTEGCMGAIIILARECDDTSKEIQFLACDTLATLSHWFRRSSMTGIDKDSHSSSSGTDFPTLDNYVWNQFH